MVKTGCSQLNNCFYQVAVSLFPHALHKKDIVHILNFKFDFLLCSRNSGILQRMKWNIKQKINEFRLIRKIALCENKVDSTDFLFCRKGREKKIQE